MQESPETVAEEVFKVREGDGDDVRPGETGDRVLRGVLFSCCVLSSEDRYGGAGQPSRPEVVYCEQCYLGTVYWNRVAATCLP